MARASESDKKKIIGVLKKMSGDNRKGAKNPSTDAASTFGPNFGKKKDSKMRVLKKSFDRKFIHPPKTRQRKATKPRSDEQDKGGQTTQSISSQQVKGREIHLNLAKKIKEGTRDGAEGKILQNIEENFSCEVIEAEVRISGYAVKPEQFYRKQDFWRGDMDAVAIRRKKVADLCESLHLPCIKVESIKKEEKTNEDLEEMPKLEKALQHTASDLRQKNEQIVQLKGIVAEQQNRLRNDQDKVREIEELRAQLQQQMAILEEEINRELNTAQVESTELQQRLRRPCTEACLCNGRQPRKNREAATVASQGSEFVQGPSGQPDDGL